MVQVSDTHLSPHVWGGADRSSWRTTRLGTLQGEEKPVTGEMRVQVTFQQNKVRSVLRDSVRKFTYLGSRAARSHRGTSSS